MSCYLFDTIPFLTNLFFCHRWCKLSLEEVKLQKTFLLVGPKQQRLLIGLRVQGPIRSVLLVIIGLLVGNAVFSEKALRIFLIFCMKLGGYKSRKKTEPGFGKKFLIWRYSRKGLQVSPKSDTLIFFSKTALTIFLVFGLKLVLNMTFNLNETYFTEKFAIWRYLTLKLSKNCPNWDFGHFLNFALLVFLDFPHNDMWAWCLVVFIQFAGPVNLFLLFKRSFFRKVEKWYARNAI